MSVDDMSAPERSRLAIPDPRVREAIRLLNQAGWTHRELAMVFEVSDSVIGRVVRD